MAQHALFSASDAHRWMVCTKSPRLEESLEEETSVYAMEEVESLMGQPIKWAPGLPLGADSFETFYYMKD